MYIKLVLAASMILTTSSVAIFSRSYSGEDFGERVSREFTPSPGYAHFSLEDQVIKPVQTGKVTLT